MGATFRTHRPTKRSQKQLYHAPPDTLLGLALFNEFALTVMREAKIR